MKFSLRRHHLRIILLFWALPLLLGGCFYKPAVRHLASDVSLIIPGQTTQEEVTYLLGLPEVQEKSANGDDVWIYVQSHKSLLRKTPYIGENLGQADYDVVTIIFQQKVVHTASYRSLSEAEFQEAGIKFPNVLSK